MLELLQWLASSSSPWVLDLSSCVLVVLTGPLTMTSLLIPLSKFSFLSFQYKISSSHFLPEKSTRLKLRSGGLAECVVDPPEREARVVGDRTGLLAADW